jgi:SOS response regulatory protein OraA/RecX
MPKLAQALGRLQAKERSGNEIELRLMKPGTSGKIRKVNGPMRASVGLTPDREKAINFASRK